MSRGVAVNTRGAQRRTSRLEQRSPTIRRQSRRERLMALERRTFVTSFAE